MMRKELFEKQGAPAVVVAAFAMVALMVAACVAYAPGAFAQKRAQKKATPGKVSATSQRKSSSAASASTSRKATNGNTSAVPSTPQVRGAATTQASKTTAPVQSTGRTLAVQTQPGAIVWVDEVRRGVADAAGNLTVALSPGRHALRVRASGFQERTLALLPTQRGALEVRLTQTTDEAELLFQQAEETREKGGGDAGRQKAAELYRNALKVRPQFPAAHVGLARVLLAQDDYDAALEQIAEARRDRAVYPEASAVEGRVLRGMADNDAALEAYRRAIREGRGFQPEAYTGMGIVLEEKGDYEGAVAAFRKAIAQLSDSEPALYQLIGAAYEKLERWKEAVAAYEKYLELAPEGNQASAIRSIIDQLRQQAAEQQQSNNPE